MRRSIARFVVDTHCHITTLYQPGTEAGWEKVEKEEWTGLGRPNSQPFDNCFLTMYDMDRYGVDMAVLLPSIAGHPERDPGEAGQAIPGQVPGLLQRPEDRAQRRTGRGAVELQGGACRGRGGTEDWLVRGNR